MIKYEWRTELDTHESDELAALLQRAAAYDAEPEYTTIAIDDVLDAMARHDRQLRHLLIWMLPYATAIGEPDQPERIAGLLRLRVAPDGTGHAAMVIDPALRSIGITTLLLERVGLDTAAPDGWLGSGAREINAWAQGNHPAAGRLSNRFLIPRTRRVWKLIRSTDSDEFTSAAAPVLEVITPNTRDDLGWAADLDGTDALALREDGRLVGMVTMNVDPVGSEEFGLCATITGYRAAPAASARARRGLLDGAAAAAHEAGRTGVIIHVDSDDTEWVNPCRLSGFQHDRTDVRFQLGGHR
jgi:mycothiol synthase